MLDFNAVRRKLAEYSIRSIEQSGLRPAAVLLPLYVREEKPYVFFTRRTDHLPHHRGEISFPGGRYHAGDVDLEETALRETEEEMGICAADVVILGRLDDFISIHGYHVVPFVGTFPYPYPFQINHHEIAEVIEVPLSRLRDPAIFRTEDWRHRGRDLPVCFFDLGVHQVWGLTASILRQFLKRIEAIPV
jgi:8-oxo-dGTP pyrophosphatase MutT (NUDIX family)